MPQLRTITNLAVVLLKIGTLKGFYLFEQPRIHKRSVLPNNTYHGTLIKEPEVLSIQCDFSLEY